MTNQLLRSIRSTSIRLRRYVALLAALTLTAASQPAFGQLPMRLWYDQPAQLFEESLPIGNGKLGALVYGSPDKDILHLNDITFWSGKPVDLSIDSTAYKALPEVREALFREDYRAADSLQHKLQGHDCKDYMPLGTLTMTDLMAGESTRYRRELNLDSALCRDEYQRGDVTIRRTYFASHPDKVIVIRLTASQPGALNYHLGLSAKVNHSVKASAQQLTMTGNAVGDPEETIHFCTILSVENKDGNVVRQGNNLVIEGATEATIYIVNETSFNGYDKHPVREGAPYLEMAADDAWHLKNMTYDSILVRHLADYQTIYQRVKFGLAGAELNHEETTEEMLRNYGNGAPQDKYLETLYFQYGRYMLISSSRTPGVPANLQGLWSEKLYAPWHGNYTININLEENYWPCDVANMPEMFNALSTFTQNLSQTGHRNAQNYYGIGKGWSCGHNSDIWAMSNPVGEKEQSPKWSNWNMGAAWLMQNIYDHYLYTADKQYLRNTAYPQMKGAAEFALAWLIENPKQPGELITAPSTSPEAEYKTPDGYEGCTMYGGTADLALIRELFTNTIEAAQTLGVDKALQGELKNALDKLRPYTIGHMGDINEWYYDWDDADFLHRHQSHLIGLYPGHQITVDGTPELAKAAAKSLEIKGDITTGWSTGWRINLWARLHNAQQAYHIYQKLLLYVDPRNTKKQHGGTFPNLFDAHPPFQIDGNFGGTAGVCEMLMQSGNGEIELLPALPEQWADGQIEGLKARGGYTLSFAWKDGQVTSATISGVQNGKVKVKMNGQTKTVQVKKGKTTTVLPD